MGKISILPLAVFIFLAAAAPVSAHLPYLAGDKAEIAVGSPEISKAYYGWLSGKPAVYSISSPKPFLLYLNLLAPQGDGARLDYSARIYKNGDLLETIEDDDALWLAEYEPFANDYYSKGPEYEARVPAGDYRVEVYNSGNSGNYVLAVGKTEDLSLGQFLRTLAVLPRIKEQFWGKPWWEAYNNLVGLFAFVLLVILTVIIYFAASIIKRWKLKAKLDNEYQNYRRAR
jgi:hypothetical protein